LRIAHEKEVEFLKLFDSPSVMECYERKMSVMPQQALALANSELAITQSRLLAHSLAEGVGNNPAQFIRLAFRRILSRHPTKEELEFCQDFLVAQSTRRIASTSGSPRASESSPTSENCTPEDTALRPSIAVDERAFENLVLILFNHNDFVSIR
jgi:hypothetical protein